jgi:hypothetical protein
LTQWRKTFKIFKSSRMQCLNIFEFTCLSGVWKFENYLTGPGPHVSGLCAFDRPGWSPGPTRRPYSQWLCSPHRERSVPVATGRHHPPELPPLTTAPVVTEEAIAHFAFTCPPPFGHAPHCSAPLWSPLRPSPTSRPELSVWVKRSALSPCPSYIQSLPAAPASEAGPRDFLRRRLPS